MTNQNNIKCVSSVEYVQCAVYKPTAILLKVIKIKAFFLHQEVEPNENAGISELPVRIANQRNAHNGNQNT